MGSLAVHQRLFPILELSNARTPASIQGLKLVTPLSEVFHFYETSPLFYTSNYIKHLPTRLKTKSGVNTSHLMGICHFMNKLKGHGASPIFVAESTESMRRMFERRKFSVSKTRVFPEVALEEAMKTQRPAEILNYLRLTADLNEEDVINGYDLIRAFGYPIKLPGTSRNKQIAFLTKQNAPAAFFPAVYGAWKHGGLSQLTFQSNPKRDFLKVDLSQILEESKLTMEQFQEVCLIIQKRESPSSKFTTIPIEALQSLMQENRTRPVRFFETLKAKYPKADWFVLDNQKSQVNIPPEDAGEVHAAPIEDVDEFKKFLRDKIRGIEEDTSFNYIVKLFETHLADQNGVFSLRTYMTDRVDSFQGSPQSSQQPQAAPRARKRYIEEESYRPRNRTTDKDPQTTKKSG